MSVTETELKQYLLDNIGTNDSITISIIESYKIKLVTKSAFSSPDAKDLEFCAKINYDTNVLSVNKACTLQQILHDVKRCIFYDPRWQKMIEETTGMTLYQPEDPEYN